MGGTIRVILREEDGKLHNMLRWTNSFPAFFKSTKFIFLYIYRKQEYMKNKIREIIRKSINGLFDNHQSQQKPKIFQSTIYRLPNKEELENVNSFNLNAEEILDGFSYTIIGRGIFSDKNKEMIIQSIKMLCDLFPENSEYKTALKKAMDV